MWKATVAAAALAVGLVACDRPPSPAAAVEEFPADLPPETVALNGAGRARLAEMDEASKQFCVMRLGGQPQIQRFLDRAEACNSGDLAPANRCAALATDENRLLSVFARDIAVQAVLQRAKTRPWPACPRPEVEAPADEETAADEPPSEEEAEALEEAAE